MHQYLSHDLSVTPDAKNFYASIIGIKTRTFKEEIADGLSLHFYSVVQLPCY